MEQFDTESNCKDTEFCNDCLWLAEEIEDDETDLLELDRILHVAYFK